MKVQTLGCCGWMVMFTAVLATLSADAREPSEEALSQMGLGGLVMMSDDEAMAVRGLGFKSMAKAWGQSWAQVTTKHGSAGSVNGYKAVGRKKASGENFSEAGFEIRFSGGKGGHGDKGRKGKDAKKGRPPKGGNDVSPATFGKNGRGDIGKNGGKGGGHKGGKGGKPQVKSFNVFAGGFSSAKVKN